MHVDSSRISRRGLVRALAAAAIVPLPVRASAQAYRERRALMGTWVDIEVPASAGGQAEASVDAAFREMQRRAAMMTRYDRGSPLAALNAAAGLHPVRVPPELMEVLQQARAVHARTAGAFDATIGRLSPAALRSDAIPDERALRASLAHVGMHRLELDPERGIAFLADPATQLDLGGIAKLPILEAGMAVLHAHGVRGALINGGGDVLASARPDARAWRIGVRDPIAPERLLAVVSVHEGVVASSGDYERFVMHEGRRYHHVIDPATGRPTRGIRGVTLVADRVAPLNGIGTAAMVAGPRGYAALLARCAVGSALVACEDGSVRATASLLRRLEPPPGRGRIRGLG